MTIGRGCPNLTDFLLDYSEIKVQKGLSHLFSACEKLRRVQLLRILPADEEDWKAMSELKDLDYFYLELISCE